MGALWASAVSLGIFALTVQSGPDPALLIQQADRLAWLRAWGEAEPLYRQARVLYSARGDQRNALYAEVSALRGQLPRLPVPEVSSRLSDYLENPIVHADEGLRLRCLVVKGETDEDLDPFLSAQSWREVETVATRLQDPALANRAKGELGLLSFLQGDVGASIIGLGNALKVAETNGDVSSQVRWLTLFGLGYLQLGRAEESLQFFGRALKVVAAVPELPFPLMTYVGRSNALIKLGRAKEAEQVLSQARVVANQFEARGYQAQLLAQQATIAFQLRQTERALDLLAQATNVAKAAGANRLVAEMALDTSQILRSHGRLDVAERTVKSGIDVARAMDERLLLPRLLAELAGIRSSQRRYGAASSLLDEASDVMEGLFTTASSPWVQSRLVTGMDEVFLARIRLEGQRQDVGKVFAAIEDARGRSLIQLLANRPVSSERQSSELRAGAQRISLLQRRLLETSERTARRRLLDQIFEAEEQLAPATVALFDGTRRTSARRVVSLGDLQRTLRSDEVFVEFALLDPESYALVVTSTTARVQRLSSRGSVASLTEAMLKRVQAGLDPNDEAGKVSNALLSSIPELDLKRRLIVSPDGELHQVPFELLVRSGGHRLLDSHVVSYVMSGSVLRLLRSRTPSVPASQHVLAISASPSEMTAKVASAQAVTRSVYDIDASQLRPLPSANDEVRSVASIFGPANTTVLLGERATESELKRQSLSQFQVLHFAVHGIPSIKFPARAALLVRPGGDDDGILQAREILMLRLNAELVTLSACDTGNGSVHGQDGAASLVRPFIAAGARTVVANLWAADDTFSLALMREFYKLLAAGDDVAEALRDAKLAMLKTFGPEAIPRLWSGVLVYGDGRGTVAKLGIAASR